MRIWVVNPYIKYRNYYILKSGRCQVNEVLLYQDVSDGQCKYTLLWVYGEKDKMGLPDDIGLDCQFVPVEQVVRMRPVFELVAADVLRTSAFR